MTWLQKVFNIRSGTDYENTAASIISQISIKGVNAWLMICSALLASIGLDTNSTAVIIGAMLISPLMAPILGVGYAVGVQDSEMFIRSVRNLAYGTFFSLGTSFLYFSVTPLGEITTEILARTKPTLLDIGVAFFGGIAGIVSGSRKQVTNAIPGVAIATALMPPICAAGFGLASKKWDVFGGAFYLFCINAIFIAFSTYLIVKLLKFPIKRYVEAKTQRRVARAAATVMFLVSIPSMWFLYNVYIASSTKNKIQNNIINDFKRRGNEILKWEIENLDSMQLIKTFYSGVETSGEETNYYNTKLKDLGLKHYRIEFFRMNISKNEMDKMSTEMMTNIMKNIEYENAKMKDSLSKIGETVNAQGLYSEIKSFYPNINQAGITRFYLAGTKKTDTVWAAYVTWDSLADKINKPQAISSIQHYLQKRLPADTVWIFSHE